MGMWSLRILNLVLGPAEGGLCDSPGKWRQMTIWHCSLQVLETSLLPHLQTLSSLSKACPVPCSLSIPIPVFLLFFNLSLEKSFWEQQGEGCGLPCWKGRPQSEASKLAGLPCPWEGHAPTGETPGDVQKVSTWNQGNGPHRMIIKSYLKMRWGEGGQNKSRWKEKEVGSRRNWCSVFWGLPGS